jgi:monovalent cation:proton antiporter-2 (CPA2) family protein
MQSQSHMIQDAVVFLSSAVVCVPLFRKAGLGAILGYLAAGVAIGPWGLRMVEDPQNILSFAELGVVFLLFLIGLELKPARLWAMRTSVFGLGGVQVGVTTLLMGAALHWLFAFSFREAVILGVALALSSTAFALQMLSERNELKTEPGRYAFAILLLQDLAVIPILAILPLLSPQAPAQLQGGLEKSVLAVGAVVAVFAGGRYLVRPFFRWVVAGHTREVFAAASLLVVLGVSWFISWVGLSMALGAFLAGVVLADSEYRHELEANIDSFKGLLLGLFFIAVGMSVDWGLVISQPLNVLKWVTTLVLVKFVVLWCLGRWLGFRGWIAARFAGTLSQGGEFAFVLATICLNLGLLSAETGQMMNLTVAVSMALTPLIMFALDRACTKSGLHNVEPGPTYDVPNEESEVIIAGFGRVGQIVGRLLRMRNIRFTALEQDFNQVEVVRRFGNKVYFGDASRLDLLEAAKAGQAKFFFLCIDDVDASVRCADTVKKHFPNLRIIARARNRAHAFKLLDLGINGNDIIRETMASSIEMVAKSLLETGETRESLDVLIKTFREFDEKMLQEQYKVYGDENAMINVSKQAAEQLARVMQQDQQFQKTQKEKLG